MTETGYVKTIACLATNTVGRVADFLLSIELGAILLQHRVS